MLLCSSPILMLKTPGPEGPVDNMFADQCLRTISIDSAMIVTRMTHIVVPSPMWDSGSMCTIAKWDSVLVVNSTYPFSAEYVHSSSTMFPSEAKCQILMFSADSPSLS